MGSRRHALKEKLTWDIISEPSKEVVEQLMLIEASAHDDPWTYDSLMECFTDNCRCIGLYLNNELIGFCVICIIFDEAEIYTIGILKKYQGLGFGHKLLLKSLQLSKELGAKNCYLEVRVSNEVALYLYDLYGFQITGIRKNYYAATSEHPAEDAYTMACNLEEIDMNDPFLKV
ncbi:ribosomal protein S18-alanine N-acetyltransferase [Anaerobiospirillum sp. NML120448]|uniref:ribosomal protein S18-alanine N-acetyltransferase n=1 Tax=Anaerobiospirillum sp. NML120448 TaxID=2932816 RepID=UPI001FF6F2FA|nr:ribosomal protein S18-alanine N-acetyltransferase [Anaerobiospirillum sp. NML120448]MCK0513664.1 ribosomal protein S18-alanine N-acetyltransferase [Anaerobiospirillum sp. NML120448]